MDLDAVRELVYEWLSEPVAQMGCAGPPEGTLPDCKSEGKHDTGLGMFSGVIELTIDDKTFTIRVEESEEISGG